MSAPLRLALVGAGAIGTAYAEAAEHVEEVSLDYVVDIRQDVVGSLAESVAATSVSDAGALACSGQVDLALVCTPPNTHEELCTAFLEAGVPVLCEKPLAPDSRSARRVLAVAARTGTPLTMASKFRFVSDVIQARQLIHDGVLGDIVRAEVAFASRVDMSGRWNADPAIAGGGVIIDNGTHAVDIVRYVLGPIDSVLATTEHAIRDLRVEDTAAMLLRTSAGHIGSVDLSWSLDRLTQRYLAIFGTEGSLEVNWSGSRLRLAAAQSDVVFGEGYTKISALAANLRNVAGAVRGTCEFVVTPADAIASVAVVEAAYESVQTACWQIVRSRQQERLSA